MIAHVIIFLSKLIQIVIFVFQDGVILYFGFRTQALQPCFFVLLVFQIIDSTELQIICVMVFQTKGVTFTHKVVRIKSRLSFIDT